MGRLYSRRLGAADRPRSRGQALVEFALILPLLALLLVMAIDFGRVFFGWVALHNAARIASDYAARTADSWPAPSGGSIGAQARDRYYDLVISDLTSINCSPDATVDAAWTNGDIPAPTFLNPDGSTTGDVKEPGDHAYVALDCSFGLVTPLAETLLGAQLPDRRPVPDTDACTDPTAGSDRLRGH